MQEETLTLTVDETNDGETTANVNHVYKRFDTFNTRSIYHHANNQPDLRDILSFYRTEAKRNGNYRGARRSSFKFTKDVTVLGFDGSNIVVPMYFEVNASIPLGVTEEVMMVQRQKCVALLDDDTISGPLNKDLSI